MNKNISRKIFIDEELLRKNFSPVEMAFIVKINRTSKASYTITNKALVKHLGLGKQTESYISRMIKNINFKWNKNNGKDLILIKTVTVDSRGKVTNNKDKISKAARFLFLSRTLHLEKTSYVAIEEKYLLNKEFFSGNNELLIIKYLNSLKTDFEGFLSKISVWTNKSINVIKRALKKLQNKKIILWSLKTISSVINGQIYKVSLIKVNQNKNEPSFEDSFNLSDWPNLDL